MAKMKNLFVFMMMLVMMIIGTNSVSAAVIDIDGAVIEKGRTLVQLRPIFEELGATIKWDNKTKTVTATKQGKEIWLKIGSKTTKINGKNVTM